MASEAQIRANRANALRSTGPRTERGKAISRLNGRKHGLRSALPLPETDLLRRFRSDFRKEWRPATAEAEAWVEVLAILACKIITVHHLMNEAFRQKHPRQVAFRMYTLTRYWASSFNMFCRVHQHLVSLKAPAVRRMRIGFGRAIRREQPRERRPIHRAGATCRRRKRAAAPI